MDIEEIWTSILIPLLVGPLFIFFKSLWDRTQEAKLTLKNNQYEEELVRLKDELTMFYYPLYLNLLNLYGLCFSIPVEQEDEDPSISSSDSELSDGEEHGKKHYKKRRCKAYYKNEDNIIQTCRNVIPHNVSSKICKNCRWRMVRGDVEMGILDTKEEYEEEEDNYEIAEQKTEYSGSKSRITKRNKKKRRRLRSLKNKNDSEEEIRISIPTLSGLPNSSSSLDKSIDGVLVHEPTQLTLDLEPIETSSMDLNLNIANQFKLLSVSLSQECINALLKTSEPYYGIISEIIEKNIHRVEPDTRLMTHLLRFMKYAKIKKIFFEHQLLGKENECKPEHLGVEDNIVKLLTHIEACIKTKGKQLRKLIKEGDAHM